MQLWSQMKRKPVFVVRGAHGPHPNAAAYAPAVSAGAPAEAASAFTAAAASAAAAAAAAGATGEAAAAGPGALPDVTGWVQAVAVCRGSDLVASGAGDGAIKLWSVEPSPQGGAGSLKFIGGLPARGFVNGLALGRSGRLVVAAMGQEPRCGRWLRDPKARNGLLVHRLGSSLESGI